MSSPSAITVSELEHSYGDRRALAGVTFEVPSRAIFGFAGPNGGGKSTLFHLLSTLLPVQSGDAQALGLNLKTQGDDYRRQIGVTFQVPSLDRRLTVQENLTHQGHLYGLRDRQLEERAKHLLELFQVADRMSDIVDTLSGGLKRRVELAKCLLHRPRLLLLDEPSTGLDPRARHDLWQCLEQMRSDEAVTVVLTTHLMEEAESCDELILLDRGSIVAQGTPDSLRESVQGDRLRIRCDQPEQLLSQLRAAELEFDNATDSLVMRSEDGQSVLRQVLDQFGAQVRSVSLDRPSLNDVFLEKTGREYSQEA